METGLVISLLNDLWGAEGLGVGGFLFKVLHCPEKQKLFPLVTIGIKFEAVLIHSKRRSHVFISLQDSVSLS